MVVIQPMNQLDHSLCRDQQLLQRAMELNLNRALFYIVRLLSLDLYKLPLYNSRAIRL